MRTVFWTMTMTMTIWTGRYENKIKQKTQRMNLKMINMSHRVKGVESVHLCESTNIGYWHCHPIHPFILFSILLIPQLPIPFTILLLASNLGKSLQPFSMQQISVSTRMYTFRCVWSHLSFSSGMVFSCDINTFYFRLGFLRMVWGGGCKIFEIVSAGQLYYGFWEVTAAEISSKNHAVR